MLKCTKCKDCPDRSINPNCHDPEICKYWAKYINMKQKEREAKDNCRMVDNTRFENYTKLKTRFINRRGHNYK